MKITLLFFTFVFLHCSMYGQADTTAKKDSSSFDHFNTKMEKLFKIIPVPTFSYSSEAGTMVGLAKFNLFQASKKDTISGPSKISGVVSMSTNGWINASIANDMVFDKNNYLVVSYINYKKQPEFIFGIGNDVKRTDQEQVKQERFVFSCTAMRKIKDKLFAGIIFNVADYFNIQTDSNSILIKENAIGLDGGVTVGVGPDLLLDTRDSRYNPSKGFFTDAGIAWNFGAYHFNKFHLDLRKYFTPFKNRIVLAMQTTTTAASGEIPFYDLSMLGSDGRMRGYYEGALRDKVALDAQVELRVPVWKIFGVTGFVGAGQVSPNYNSLAMNGFWFSYGGGLRVRVDTKNNTNLRFDMGFGKSGIKAFYINFAEAF